MHAKAFALSLDAQHPVFEWFTKFLAELFLDKPCYKDLTHFTDLISSSALRPLLSGRCHRSSASCMPLPD